MTQYEFHFAKPFNRSRFPQAVATAFSMKSLSVTGVAMEWKLYKAFELNK